MLPSLAASSSSSSSQVVPSSTAPASQRTGRLRGLSYLRHHYAHGHSQSTSLPAAPTVTPANASSGSTHHTHSILSHATPALSSSPPTSVQTSRQRSTSPLNNAVSWIPTVSGVSGLSRVGSRPSAELSNTSGLVSNNSSSVRPTESAASVRSIDETIANPLDPTPNHGPANLPLVRSPSNNARVAQTGDPAASIRFIPHIDQRASRESLIFPPIERTLRSKDERIRVGRYSDRDLSNPSAPVGFKSKVVSRRHCEFWCDGGQWYVKDVKSSSGTFLNHIRLSAPGMESKAYPLYDGDILQLGIDFKGGEEQIFRCVKIRVELNRAWQKSLNNFNMSAHRRIRNLAKSNSNAAAKAKDGDSCSTHTSECSICLMPVAPCQSLFVAPCSHVWHYKCIRPLVEKEYPTFLCPNCRAIADLDRDIEENEPGEGWEVFDDEQHGEGLASVVTKTEESSAEPTHDISREKLERPSEQTIAINETDHPLIDHPLIDQQPSDPILGSTSTIPSSPVEIRQASSSRATGSWSRRNERVRDLDLQQEGGSAEDCRNGSGSSSSGGEGGHEGPMTPMNDAGPFVFDGGSFSGLEGSESRGGNEDVVTMDGEEEVGDETRVEASEMGA